MENKTISLNYNIIPVSETFINSFRETLDSVCREKEYLAFTEAPPVDAIKDFIKELIKKGNIQFLAVIDKKVIGWCDIVKIELPGFDHTGRLGMGVLKEFRGMGIGYKLAAEAIKCAQQKGLKRIELEVFSSNKPAIELYFKLGFNFEGRKIKARYINGNYDNIDIMALLI